MDWSGPLASQQVKQPRVARQASLPDRHVFHVLQLPLGRLLPAETLSSAVWVLCSPALHSVALHCPTQGQQQASLGVSGQSPTQAAVTACCAPAGCLRTGWSPMTRRGAGC